MAKAYMTTNFQSTDDLKLNSRLCYLEMPRRISDIHPTHFDTKPPEEGKKEDSNIDKEPEELLENDIEFMETAQEKADYLRKSQEDISLDNLYTEENSQTKPTEYNEAIRQNDIKALISEIKNTYGVTVDTLGNIPKGFLSRNVKKANRNWSIIGPKIQEIINLNKEAVAQEQETIATQEEKQQVQKEFKTGQRKGLRRRIGNFLGGVALMFGAHTAGEEIKDYSDAQDNLATAERNEKYMQGQDREKFDNIRFEPEYERVSSQSFPNRHINVISPEQQRSFAEQASKSVLSETVPIDASAFDAPEPKVKEDTQGPANVKFSPETVSVKQEDKPLEFDPIAVPEADIVSGTPEFEGAEEPSRYRDLNKKGQEVEVSWEPTKPKTQTKKEARGIHISGSSPAKYRSESEKRAAERNARKRHGDAKARRSENKK
jgi:hypothetical protein